MWLLTDEEIIMDICGSCFQEERLTDEDCRACQRNMKAAAKAQAKKIAEKLITRLPFSVTESILEEVEK